MTLQVIGLIGVIGSGKSFFAQEYVKQGYFELPMAKPIKEILSSLFKADFFDDSAKDQVFNLNDEQFTGRKLMTKLGDEMRAKNPYFWANAWKSDAEKLVAYDDCFYIIVPDVRYKEEIEVIYDTSDHNAERFIFCNYRSNRYNADNDYKSEKLAQHLLKKGLKHGHELNYGELIKLTEDMEVKL